jgi:hypothetical protein
MLHWPGQALERPIDVPLWISVLGSRGNERAHEVADGIVGPPHPTLPSATMLSGTVLEPGEDGGSDRVRRAIGPWRVVRWHTAYAVGGAAAVDAMPGGPEWRASLEALAPDAQGHLFTFEGHVTNLAPRDLPLLDHINVTATVGEPSAIRRELDQLASVGHSEVMYTPTGPMSHASCGHLQPRIDRDWYRALDCIHPFSLCRDGQLMSSDGQPAEAEIGWLASVQLRGTSTRAEDWIRTRDPHLGSWRFSFVRVRQVP